MNEQNTEWLNTNIWPNVKRVGGCLVWTGRLNEGGYPTSHRARRDMGSQYVHRAVWIAFNGQPPEGMEVDHVCFNRACVNPAHLRLLTVLENRRIGRRNWLLRRPYCAKGHLKSGENLIVTAKGHHRCRECHRAAVRAYEARGRTRLDGSGGLGVSSD